MRADLVQDVAIHELAGQKILAFAGIALPEKFFGPLRQAGAILAAAWPFPDHHAYTERDLKRLVAQAQGLGAILVTTPKDAVRLPSAIRALVTVVGVGLTWQNPAEIDQLLDRVMASGLHPVAYSSHG